MRTIQAGRPDSRMQLVPAPHGLRWAEKAGGLTFYYVRKKENNGEKKINYLVSLEADISWHPRSSLITLDTHHQRVKIANSNGQSAQVDARQCIVQQQVSLPAPDKTELLADCRSC